MNTKKIFGYGFITVMLALAFFACEDPTAAPKNKELSGTISITPSPTVTTGTELTAVYSGSEGVSYQWNKNETAINGATSSKFTPVEAGSYTVTVSATGYNSKTSALVTVSISDSSGELELSGTVSISPSTNVKTGAELTASYDGTETVSYHWNKNGEAIPNATEVTYTAEEPGRYTVTVKAEGYKPKTSAEVEVTGAALPALSGEVTITPHENITTGMELTASYSGEENVSYHWNKDDAAISGATSNKYKPVETGKYTVTVSAAGYHSKTSTAVTVSYPTPVAADFDISGNETFTYDGNPKAVSVTAKEGKTAGTVTVKYNDAAGAPSAAGTYTVTFDVAAATGWNKADGLSAGTLTINPAVVSIAAIEGVTAPVSGATPVTSITETAQYTGAVAWSPEVTETFAFSTAYTATITLTAKSNYTLTGVEADFFTVEDAESVSNAADSGEVTAVFVFRAFEYIITGSGTTFTATRGGETVGTADQTIQNVINAIRTNADGKACAIQFGDGTAETTGTLNIGTASAQFNITGGTWGLITLTGKITSANTETNIQSTVYIDSDISVNSTADIANTDTGLVARAIYTRGTLMTISGGTVSASQAVAISGTGTVTINGGTISTTRSSGNAVNNGNNNTLMISGGTFSATEGYGVAVNNGTGTVTISGGIFSAMGDSGRAVSNGAGTVTISGGTFSAMGNSVANNSTGTITINGGTITGNNAAVYNNQGTITLGGNPEITERIYLDNTTTLSLSSDPQFNPGSKVYILAFADAQYTVGRVAVTGGAGFENNFKLPSTVTAWKLAESDGNLVLAAE